MQMFMCQQRCNNAHLHTMYNLKVAMFTQLYLPSTTSSSNRRCYEFNLFEYSCLNFKHNLLSFRDVNTKTTFQKWSYFWWKVVVLLTSHFIFTQNRTYQLLFNISNSFIMIMIPNTYITWLLYLEIKHL